MGELLSLLPNFYVEQQFRADKELFMSEEEIKLSKFYIYGILKKGERVVSLSQFRASNFFTTFAPSSQRQTFPTGEDTTSMQTGQPLPFQTTGLQFPQFGTQPQFGSFATTQQTQTTLPFGGGQNVFSRQTATAPSTGTASTVLSSFTSQAPTGITAPLSGSSVFSRPPTGSSTGLPPSTATTMPTTLTQTTLTVQPQPLSPASQRRLREIRRAISSRTKVPPTQGTYSGRFVLGLLSPPTVLPPMKSGAIDPLTGVEAGTAGIEKIPSTFYSDMYRISTGGDRTIFDAILQATAPAYINDLTVAGRNARRDRFRLALATYLTTGRGKQVWSAADGNLYLRAATAYLANRSAFVAAEWDKKFIADTLDEEMKNAYAPANAILAQIDSKGQVGVDELYKQLEESWKVAIVAAGIAQKKAAISSKALDTRMYQIKAALSNPSRIGPFNDLVSAIGDPTVKLGNEILPILADFLNISIVVVKATNVDTYIKDAASPKKNGVLSAPYIIISGSKDRGYDTIGIKRKNVIKTVLGKGPLFDKLRSACPVSPIGIIPSTDLNGKSQLAEMMAVILWGIGIRKFRDSSDGGKEEYPPHPNVLNLLGFPINGRETTRFKDGKEIVFGKETGPTDYFVDVYTDLYLNIVGHMSNFIDNGMSNLEGGGSILSSIENAVFFRDGKEIEGKFSDNEFKGLSEDDKGFVNPELLRFSRLVPGSVAQRRVEEKKPLPRPVVSSQPPVADLFSFTSPALPSTFGTSSSMSGTGSSFSSTTLPVSFI